jgi:hypothetical protein
LIAGRHPFGALFLPPRVHLPDATLPCHAQAGRQRSIV